MELCSTLAAPRGEFGFFERGDLVGSDFLSGEDEVALAICTIGDAVEKTVKQLSSSGELALAVTVDAVGSVTAEATADEINRYICDMAAKRGLRSRPRFSPGYGKWMLSEQAIVFDLLPADRIGVRLTESFMMIPRKSVSFAVRFSEVDDDIPTNPCDNCGLKNCRMRKASKHGNDGLK
jgi:cobalamin-dependent methionine synthase I